MQANDWLQLALYVAALALITKPLGLFLVQVMDPNGRTWLDPVVKPLERVTYRILGVKPGVEHDWMHYTGAMLAFSLASLLFTYAILRLQHLLPFNPQGFGPMASHLAFNTAVSFTTNTNWQSYGGESTLGYFAQMIVPIMAVAGALVQKKAAPRQRRHISRVRFHIHRVAYRHGDSHRRTELPARARARPHRRALPHCAGEIVLTMDCARWR